MTDNSQNSNKSPLGMNVGSASILLIFVILSLVAFATLSIVSANADRKLSQKVLERTTAYYTACNQAETTLANIDNTLQNIYSSCEDEEAYFSAVGHHKSYAIPISDLQTLHITLEILYPREADDTFYQITSWQVIATGELE